MELPIYENGAVIGQVCRCAEGLYTVFEARLPPREGLTRLWVVGGGESACLGLMEPRPEGLYLRKKFSRAGLNKLPKELEHATVGEKPAEADNIRPPTHTRPVEAAPSASPWALRLDGSLIDLERRLLALPCALRRKVPGLRVAKIDGREYLLFRY